MESYAQEEESPDHATSVFLTNQGGSVTNPHSYPRYNFSFLLKYGYFEPSLPFQTPSLVQICTAEESSTSAPSSQSPHVGYTVTQLRSCCDNNCPVKARGSF